MIKPILAIALSFLLLGCAKNEIGDSGNIGDSKPTGYGGWGLSKEGGVIIAGLKSISSDGAAIMVANSESRAAFSFLETSKTDTLKCKNGLMIENEYFEPKVSSMSKNGESACSYIIQGREAEYIIGIIESKKTMYIDGVVFDTSGFEFIKGSLTN